MEKEQGYTVPILKLVIAQSQVGRFQLGGTLQKQKYHESQILFETDGTVG